MNLTPEALTPWIETRYTRAAGPGGQHVNKVSTRAELLFDFQSCALLSPQQKDALRESRLRSRFSADGRLRVAAQATRSQVDNRAAAMQRLIELLAEALHVEAPRTPTRATRASQRRRVDDKRLRSKTKQMRGRIAD